MVDEGKLPDMKTGSVKAAARILEGNNPTVKKLQSIYPQSYQKTRELHQAARNTHQLKETRELAESEMAEAKSELSAANKAVRNLTRRIQEANSSSKAQTPELECEAMRELESAKRELSKLKFDMASVLEEKERAEDKSEKSMSKTESCLDSVRVLNKEIEETNEEHVLVELARIEAIKEYDEIEACRIEKAAFYSAILEEKRKKKQEMDREYQEAKELETKLATTVSDIEFLESELKQTEERDERIVNHEELASVMKELEVTRKEVTLVQDDSFRLMASMDVLRNELMNVTHQTARLKKKEEKTEMNIQNLNSKLLRAKAWLEATSTSEDNSNLMFSDLMVTLGRLISEIEASKNERALIGQEISFIREDTQRTKNDTDFGEERLQAALQDLRAAKSSEIASLENLKSLNEKTMRDRASASRASSTITISEFEYEYLKGGAAVAHEVADKKVEAAKAWVEALKASGKENNMKSEVSRRKARVEEEERKVGQNEESMGDENDFEKWRQMMDSEKAKPRIGFPGKGLSRSVKRMTPLKIGKARRSESPIVRGTSFSVRRRRKVMPNLAKLFGAKSIGTNM